MSRVVEASATALYFERPRDFDLARYWRESTERFEAEYYPNQARLRLTDLGVRLSGYLMPGYGTMRMRVTDTPDENGWFKATMPVGSLEAATSDLLRLAAEVEVLEPAELRDHFVRTVGRISYDAENSYHRHIWLPLPSPLSCSDTGASESFRSAGRPSLPEVRAHTIEPPSFSNEGADTGR